MLFKAPGLWSSPWEPTRNRTEAPAAGLERNLEITGTCVPSLPPSFIHSFIHPCIQQRFTKHLFGKMLLDALLNMVPADLLECRSVLVRSRAVQTFPEPSASVSPPL